MPNEIDKFLVSSGLCGLSGFPQKCVLCLGFFKFWFTAKFLVWIFASVVWVLCKLRNFGVGFWRRLSASVLAWCLILIH